MVWDGFVGEMSLEAKAPHIGSCQKNGGKCNKGFLVVIRADEVSNTSMGRASACSEGVVKMDRRGGEYHGPHLISASSIEKSGFWTENRNSGIAKGLHEAWSR